MGAWGTDPRDNDNAAEYIDEIVSLVNRKIESVVTKKTKHTHDMWAALGLIVWAADLGIADEGICRHGDELVGEIEDDPDWIAEWGDPRAVRASLKKARKLFATLHDIG